MTAFSPLYETLADPFYGDGTGRWRLTKPLRYKCKLLKQTFIVPAGFEHDHASVPRTPLMFANFGNRYHRPAILHDYLCRYEAVPRDIADAIFLEAMRSQNADELRAMAAAGATDDELEERHAAIEGRAQMMYAAVALYSASGGKG